MYVAYVLYVLCMTLYIRMCMCVCYMCGVCVMYDIVHTYVYVCIFILFSFQLPVCNGRPIDRYIDNMHSYA